MKVRIQKIISKSGLCSRRRAEELIEQNRVMVNGEVAYLGLKADINIDKIYIDKCIIPRIKSNKLYLVNKPLGIISSCKDNLKRKTVIDLLPQNLRQGMYPIGRLDKESRGALLISNIGILSLHLTHPKYNHKKTYEVWVYGKLSEKKLTNWRNGVTIDGRKTKSAYVKVLEIKENKTLLKIILSEGRNKQIRKVADKLGHRVLDLKRTEIANIKLNGLKEGCWKEIKEEEWQTLVR